MTITDADHTSYRTGPILLAAALPLVALYVLFAADVPIGRPNTEGYVVYRYSPVVAWRLGNGLVALAIGACGLATLYRGLVSSGARQGFFIFLALLSYTAFVAWTFFAPPRYVAQHTINLFSPSQDGAFVIEGQSVSSIRTYVSETFYERLSQEPEDTLGRRILSNPPGVTIASVLVHRLVAGSPGLQAWLIKAFGLHELEDPAQRGEFAAALLLGFALTVLWGMALIPAYGLCRLWLPVSPAMAVAFACVVNPATVAFSPGKDPAQLLSVLAILFCWMRAYVRGHWTWAVAAGGVAVAATMISLVHVWIFGIVAGATLWHAVIGGIGWRKWLTRCLAPAVVGGMIMVGLAYLTMDWNVVKTVLCVGVRYNQIQPDIIARPFLWTFAGLPMFLLFVGPLFWIELVGMRPTVWSAMRTARTGAWSATKVKAMEPSLRAQHNEETAQPVRTADPTSLSTFRRFDVSTFSPALGRYLLICTILVMAYAYFFANNNETPRLWIPFIPLLLLGMALGLSVFRRDGRATKLLCLLLIGLQLAVTVLHWSIMDVRESEYRLTSGRMWD